MVTGGGGGDSDPEKLGWGLEVEEVLGKMLVQGIEIRWPEEGDRREGATVERADELRSALVDMRRKKKEMTGGSHNQINIWVLPGRIVRRFRADRPEAGCYMDAVGHACHFPARSKREKPRMVQPVCEVPQRRQHIREFARCNRLWVLTVLQQRPLSITWGRCSLRFES